MLSVKLLSVITLCHYTECHYAGCHYAECRGAILADIGLKKVVAKDGNNSDEIFCSIWGVYMCVYICVYIFKLGGTNVTFYVVKYVMSLMSYCIRPFGDFCSHECLITQVSGHISIWSHKCLVTQVSGHTSGWSQECLVPQVLVAQVSGSTNVWSHECLVTQVSAHKSV
jgi:hypothetical protein